MSSHGRKGKEVYHKLSKGLQKDGVKINNKLRDFIFTTSQAILRDWTAT